MSRSFTRKELYDLVWSEPMRDIAKRFEISDVGPAKACRNAEIPVPPRGYWNKQKAGHRVVMADLARRRAGHSDTITIGGDRRWHHVDRLELDEPVPPPPTFDEPIENLRAHVTKAVAQISIKTKLEVLHPAIKALLDKDEVLRGPAVMSAARQAGHMTCTRQQAERQIPLATRASSTHAPKPP